MKSEATLPGPLTLLYAGDWVALAKEPDTRWFIVEKTMFHHLIIRRDDLSESKILDADKFNSTAGRPAEWIVVEQNPEPRASIAGAYNDGGKE